MKKYSLMICLVLGACSLLSAQIKEAALQTGRPAQYGNTQWDIRLVGQWENPYLQEQVALDMYVVAPSGKKLILPCYYESGAAGGLSLWKARFTPQEKGQYSCYFQLSQAGEVVNVSKTKTFRVSSSPGKGFLHACNDWVFRFDNGMPFRGIGENIGWESRTKDDSRYFRALHENPKYNYGYMLPKLDSSGGNFFRTWICRWNLPIDWKGDFNNRRYEPAGNYYNPSALKRMDWMIRLADSLGLRIMLTLGPGAWSVADHGYVNSIARFFVDPKAMARYKNRLRYIIARWGYSTAIAAWELFNEVDNIMYRNPDHPIDPAAIVGWHDTMSAYIKQTDPYNHLVTTSISHRDLPGLNSIEHIDFNQKHIYKNTAAIPSVIKQYEEKFNKPYVIGEFAYEWDWSKNFNLFKKEMVSDFKKGLWYGLFSPTPVLPMSWWWEYFDSLGTGIYLAGVRTILDQMLAAGDGAFEPFQVNSSPKGARVLGVRCGNTKFLYAENQTAEPLTGTIGIPDDVAPSSPVKVYEGETGEYKTVKSLVMIRNRPAITIKLDPGQQQVFIIE